MKQYILALVLAVVSASVAFAVNPIKEGNMISGHVIVKGTEENIPYATVLIIGSGQGTVSNEEGQFEFRKLPAGKYKLRVSAVGYKTQEKEVTLNSTDATNLNNRLFEVTLNLNKSVNTSMLQLRIYDIDDKLNPLVRETVKNNTMIEQDF